MPNNSYIKFINFFKEHKLYDEEIFTYLRENPSPTLERYIQYLDTKILESKNKEDYRYKIALDIQSELLEYYNANNDFEKLKTKSKKLYRKYNVK